MSKRFELLSDGNIQNQQIMENLLQELERRDELIFELPEKPTTIGWTPQADIDLRKIFSRMVRYFDPPIPEYQIKQIFLVSRQKLGSEETYIRDRVTNMCLIYERVKHYPRTQCQPVEFSFSQCSEETRCYDVFDDWLNILYSH